MRHIGGTIARALAVGPAALAVVVALLPGCPARAAAPTAADRAWIAACVRQLAHERAPRADTKRRYCTCMHEQFDDNQPVTQSEMEHLYPPLHRACSAEAGWR